MSADFENKSLKDENGKTIRYANGRPILYKHFLNDLPDEEHELMAAKLIITNTIDMFLDSDIPIPASMNITEEQIESRREERKRLNLP